jgi:hypothetical protein
MKLLFKKNDSADIEVSMFVGTTEVPFSYIEMIKCLIIGESMDSEFHETISEEEQAQIKDVLKEIDRIAKEKDSSEESTTSDDSFNF